MPDADNLSQSSPPAATVWPPPPASAPETFTVEDVTVTRTGDSLLIDSPRTKRVFTLGAITIALTQAMMFGITLLMFGIVGLLFKQTSPSNHYSILDDPFLHSLMVQLAGMYAGTAVVCVGISWVFYWLTYGKGGMAFDRRSQSVKSGIRYFGGTGQVEVVIIRQGTFLFRSWHHLHYRIVGVGRYPVSARRGQWVASFRNINNVRRVAQEIGQCVGVPVQEGSA